MMSDKGKFEDGHDSNPSNGMSFLRFLSENHKDGVKVEHGKVDDESDALRLHDLDVINNADKSRKAVGDLSMITDNRSKTCFVSSDASTLPHHDPLFSANRSKKMKRRLQWRVGPLIKKPRERVRNGRVANRGNHEEASVAERTIKSFHTLHSTETELIKNKRKGAFGPRSPFDLDFAARDRHFSRNATASPRTPSTVSSYGNNDVVDDESDGETVVVAYKDHEECEEHLPQNTIGHCRYDSEGRRKNNNSTTDISKSQIGSGVRSKRNSLPPMFPHPETSKTKNLQLLPPPEIYNEDSSVSSGGRFWQLAKLQAISEGVTSPTSEKSHTNHSREATKRRIFSFSKKSSNDSVASSFSSQSQRELQKNQAERNLKAIQRLASQHLQYGEYDEAIEVLEEILRGVREMYGESHYRVGTVLHNISTVHMRYKKYDKVVHMCRKTIRVRKDTLGEMHPDVAVSYTQLGIAHMERKEYKYAVMAFHQALAIRRNTLSYRDIRITRLLNNIGCCLFELGKWNEAAKAFEQSLYIQRINMKNGNHSQASIHRACDTLTQKDLDVSNASQSLLSIASTLFNLGSIKIKQQQYDDAAIYLEEALLLQQSVLGDEHAKVMTTKDCLNMLDEKRHAISVLDVKRSSDMGMVHHLKRLIIDLDSKNGNDLSRRSPNPLGFFAEQWSHILKDFEGSPVFCKTCMQDSDDPIMFASDSESDSVGGGLRWI